MSTLSFTPLNCTDTVFCLSLSNKYLALGLENGNISIVGHNSAPASSLTLTHSIDSCNALAFSDPGSDILYSAHEGNVLAWDLRNPASPLFDLQVSEEEVNSVDVNVGDECIVTGDDMGSVSLISTSTQKVTRVFNVHSNICSAVKFRPSWPSQIISAGLDFQLVITDWKAGGRNKQKIFSMPSLNDPRRFASLLNNRQGRRDNRSDVVPVRVSICLKLVILSRLKGP